jgi:hypothetical protein
MACTRAFFMRMGGATTFMLTSGGIESGSDPILERHGEVVAKLLPAAGAWNAGKRKKGIGSEDAIEAGKRVCAHRRRAGTNMAVGLFL